jgi:hypothetical protein
MKKKADLKLVDPKDETATIKARFDELLKKTNKHEAREADVEALRELLKDNEGLNLWKRISGVMGLAENYTLECGPLSPGLNEVLRHRQSEIREQLGYKEAPEMEKLLISHAALCWLRLGQIELSYSHIMKGNNTLKLCDYWDRHLTAAQKRFERACETLERVRLMARSRQGLHLAGTKAA